MESLKKNQESGALKHGLKCREILAKYCRYLADTIFHTENWSMDFSPVFSTISPMFQYLSAFWPIFQEISRFIDWSRRGKALQPTGQHMHSQAPSHFFACHCSRGESNSSQSARVESWLPLGQASFC